MVEDATAQSIWNRACTGDMSLARTGDWALATMLDFHGYVCNGGLLDAVENRKDEDLSAAQASYRYFGLDAVAALLAEATAIAKRGDDLSRWERELDERYAVLVPADATLFESMTRTLRLNPAASRRYDPAKSLTRP